MPQTHKVLGQVSPSANTLTTLYTVPASTQSVISTLTICNQNATAATYRIAVRPAGATIASLHYLVFDSPLPANDTITLTLGLSLATTDVISVQASSTLVSFHTYGVEIT